MIYPPKDVLFDHEYHVIELVRYSPEMIRWLNDSFGEPGQRWWVSNWNIYFRDANDHLLCTIKWS